MVSLTTPICDFGAAAIDFDLDGIDGKSYSIKDVQGPNGLLIMFICNHCPYVKAIADRLTEDAKTLAAAGIGVIAIMSNDTDAYPQDSFENMKVFSDTHGFPFPYVIDRDQSIAKAYGAVCTPDFYGYNANLELQYRGRLDSAGRNPSSPGSPRELVDAMRQIAETGRGPEDQTPSIGCSIKWRDQA